MENVVDQETSRGSGRMRVWGLGCFLLATLALPVSANAISYKVLVTSADGPLEGVFLDLVTVQIGLTLDPNVPDASGDPNTGIYPNAVLGLTVEIPGIDGFVDAGPAGPAQAALGVADQPGVTYDEVSYVSGPVTASNLSGQFSTVEVRFRSDLAVPPAQPNMLDSDALPTSRLHYDEGFIFLETNEGVTSVTFEPVDSIEDDGCAIASPGRDVSRGAWLLLLPALLAWTRRRHVRRATRDE